MALIKCGECSREISDKAAACPGCGAPVPSLAHTQSETTSIPQAVQYELSADAFRGTMPLIVKLAMRAVQELGWKLDQVNENLGLITFQTGMSWGSWSGVSCSLNIEPTSSEFEFRVSGTGKQNLSGGQLIAFNIGGEAQGKAKKAIEKMKQLAAKIP